VHQSGEPDVRIRERVIDRRRHHGADSRRDPPGDFIGDQHVGQQRRVRPVLLGGTDRHDHRVMGFQEGFDFRVRHLTEENGRWFHGPPY
jgi:hypothetical protein